MLDVTGLFCFDPKQTGGGVLGAEEKSDAFVRIFGPQQVGNFPGRKTVDESPFPGRKGCCCWLVCCPDLPQKKTSRREEREEES